MAGSLVQIENSFVAQVGKPFGKGLSSLGEIVDTIDGIGINASARTVKIFAPSVKRQAKDAFYHMKEADAKAMGVKNRLDILVQETVNKQGEIRRSLAQSKSQLINYNNQLESLKSEERQIQAELSSAQNSLESAKCILSDAENELEKKKTEQGVVAGVGAGLMAIPIFGWIAGGAMLVVSLTALQDNVNAAKGAVGTKLIAFFYG